MLPKITKFNSLVMILLFFIFSCGGGGGKSSSTSQIITVPSNGFTATADNKIQGGQKDFAFGQTAKFEAKDISDESWSAVNGELNSNGQYFTPKDLNEIATDTISMNSTQNVSSREITLSPFPVHNGTYFNYNEGNQKYSIKDLSSSQAICVATFQNASTSSGEGNLNIKEIIQSANKTEKSFYNKRVTLSEKGKLNKGFSRKQLRNPLKYTFGKNQNLIKKLKSHRALDPLGTRETFFNSLADFPKIKTFEKIYSGTKCLIYSEIDTSIDLPFVNIEKGSAIGEAFEISNPYHPSAKPIFDVVTSIFGHPWGIDENGVKINDGGIDGEEQILILLYEGEPRVAGFFYSLDEEPKGTVDPDTSEISNGAEIIYLNQAFANDDLFILAVLAHEFQHLCNFNQLFALDGTGTGQNIDPNTEEARFYLFDEGLAVLAEDLNGFSMQMPNNKGNGSMSSLVNLYLSTISTFSPNFISWSSDGDYGKGYLFWRYIYDTYGEDVLKIATHNHLVPPENIEAATGKKFDVLLQELVLAILQSDSPQPIQSKIKISTLDRSKDYFDSNGVLLGKFHPIDYIDSFPDKVIKSEGPYEIRLYKLYPLNNGVSFTLENIKELSSYSIFTAIINK